MIETLGIMPQGWALSGQYAKKFLNRRGELKNIKQLKIWLFKDVLIEKYRFKLNEAELLNDFILPMLEFRPEKRITADICLAHPWLSSRSVDFKMSEEDYQNYINEAEMKRLEAIEKQEKENYENFISRAQALQNTISEEEPWPYEIQELMKHRSYVSTPDVPRELSATEGDIEDNNSTGSWFEEEEQKESLMIHEEDYHRHFRVD
jgi:serine/threonine protein kinase